MPQLIKITVVLLILLALAAAWRWTPLSEWINSENLAAWHRLNRLSRQIAKQGILAVAIIRNIPVAPFTIVNMIAGASHIKLGDYLIGTVVGMLPGILAITIFADLLLNSIQNPDWLNILIAVVLATGLILGSWWIKKRQAGKGHNR